MILDTTSDTDYLKAQEYLKKLRRLDKMIELKEVKKSRTNDQNKYIHALFKIYGLEFGYTAAETKEMLLKACPFMTYEKGSETFTRHTSELDTGEMTLLIEWIRNFSSINGLYLCSPEEYYENELQIMRELDKAKPFL